MEDFVGAALRVALEASAGGEEFAVLAEGVLHRGEDLTKGRRVLEADIPAGEGQRHIRLRYETLPRDHRHKRGALFAGLVTVEAEPLNTAIGPTMASTYSGIAAEQQAIEQDLRRRKIGSEAAPALAPGEQPRNAANVWNADRDPVPPVGEE
jgi:hypothetical protein